MKDKPVRKNCPEGGSDKGKHEGPVQSLRHEIGREDSRLEQDGQQESKMGLDGA